MYNDEEYKKKQKQVERICDRISHHTRITPKGSYYAPDVYVISILVQGRKPGIRHEFTLHNIDEAIVFLEGLEEGYYLTVLRFSYD